MYPLFKSDADSSSSQYNVWVPLYSQNIQITVDNKVHAWFTGDAHRSTPLFQGYILHAQAT